MYEKPPHARKDPIAMRPSEEQADDFKITQVREFDLLILSQEKIDLKG